MVHFIAVATVSVKHGRAALLSLLSLARSNCSPVRPILSAYDNRAYEKGVTVVYRCRHLLGECKRKCVEKKKGKTIVFLCLQEIMVLVDNEPGTWNKSIQYFLCLSVQIDSVSKRSWSLGRVSSCSSFWQN